MSGDLAPSPNWARRTVSSAVAKFLATRRSDPYAAGRLVVSAVGGRFNVVRADPHILLADSFLRLLDRHQKGRFGGRRFGCRLAHPDRLDCGGCSLHVDGVDGTVVYRIGRHRGLLHVWEASR